MQSPEVTKSLEVRVPEMPQWEAQEEAEEGAGVLGLCFVGQRKEVQTPRPRGRPRGLERRQHRWVCLAHSPPRQSRPGPLHRVLAASELGKWDLKTEHIKWDRNFTGFPHEEK